MTASWNARMFQSFRLDKKSKQGVGFFRQHVEAIYRYLFAYELTSFFLSHFHFREVITA